MTKQEESNKLEPMSGKKKNMSTVSEHCAKNPILSMAA